MKKLKTEKVKLIGKVKPLLFSILKRKIVLMRLYSLRKGIQVLFRTFRSMKLKKIMRKRI